MSKTVNILGTDYIVEHDDNLEKSGCDGICEEYAKRIRLRNSDDMLTDNDVEPLKQLRHDEVARHEVIHAFFIESGLEDYCANEQLVNWFAMQAPKIFKAFQELEII